MGGKFPFPFPSHISVISNHRGGPKPREFTEPERFSFQLNLLKTILQLEKTYEDLAQFSKQNCIILCDRGTMDGSACELQLKSSLFTQPNSDF